MTVDVPTRKAIKNWIADLSQLVRVDREHVADDEQLQLYVRMLCEEPLPSSAYTTASLHAVAADTTWWPDFATLRAKLTTWWRENCPKAAPALPYRGEAAAHLSPEDQRWLDYYHRNLPNARDDARRDHLDSLLRRYAPRAWMLVAKDRVHPAWSTPQAPETDELAFT